MLDCSTFSVKPTLNLEVLREPQGSRIEGGLAVARDAGGLSASAHHKPSSSLWQPIRLTGDGPAWGRSPQESALALRSVCLHTL